MLTTNDSYANSIRKRTRHGLRPLLLVTCLMLLFVCVAVPAIPMLPHSSGSVGPGQDPEQWTMRQDAAVRVNLSATQVKISPSDQSDFAAMVAGQAAQTTGARGATAQTGANRYAVFNLEFVSAASCARFNVPGASVFSRFERFSDIFVPLEPPDRGPAVLAAVLSAPGLIWLDRAADAVAPPPPAAVPGPLSREVPEKIVRGGMAGLTGKGVIIAIVDSGLDFRNPDFITYDAQGRPSSRLLYLWDTTSDAYDSQKLGGKAPVTYPNGASVGTLYTRDQLTAELRSTQKRIPATDLNGHGTSCAGIAAGNGNNAKGREEVLGVAPDAEIIAVRIGGAEGLMENSYLLGAICGWLDSVAAARPVVVSCSFGGHGSGHDGALVSERQIDARFPEGVKSRAIVIAAGNDATRPLHSEVKFKGADAPGRFVFAAREGRTRLSLYFDTQNIQDVRIAPAGPTVITEIEKPMMNPFTRQAAVSVIVPPGLGGLFVFNQSGTPMKANVYVYGGEFHTSSVSQSALVATPGTAVNAITVASYDWNDQFEFSGGRKPVPEICSSEPPFRPLTIGGISCYSSPGYSRNGTIKPEIAAPGQWYHASYAKTPTGAGVNAQKTLPDTSGNYRLFNGTSAATPYVAGVVALMMQKKPAITLGEIRSLLKQHASNDRYTEEVPNTWWGYGKLDLKAVEGILKAIK